MSTATQLTIKGQSLDAWEDWILSELTPPVNLSIEHTIVLEAFLELITKVK